MVWGGRGSLCSSSLSLRDSGRWPREMVSGKPNLKGLSAGLRQLSGQSPQGGAGGQVCAGTHGPSPPLAGLLPVLTPPSRAALCRDACGASSIPPCSGQQRAGGLRTHCWTSLPRPSTNLELATTGAAGAGGDPSPACPWPGPPSAGHTGIQRGRCEVPPGLWPWFPRIFVVTLPGHAVSVADQIAGLATGHCGSLPI